MSKYRSRGGISGRSKFEANVRRRNPSATGPHKCSCVGLTTSQGWKTCACPKQSSSGRSKKENAIVVLQESVAKISWRDSWHRRESAISHGSRRPQTETVGAYQWEKPVVSSRQRGIKPRRKNAGGWKGEQHPYHPYPKPSSVQSAVRGGHPESVSLQPPTSLQELTINLPNNPRLRGMSHHHIQIKSVTRRF